MTLLRLSVPISSGSQMGSNAVANMGSVSNHLSNSSKSKWHRRMTFSGMTLTLLLPVVSLGVPDDGDEEEEDDFALVEPFCAASDAFALFAVDAAVVPLVLFLSFPLPRRLLRLDISFMYSASSFYAITSKALFSAATSDGVHTLLLPPLLPPSVIFFCFMD